MTKIITNQQGKVLVANGNKVFSMTGGGGGGVTESDVNYWDYDGTLVAAYSAADFASLASAPSQPTHTGLTNQGWNWSLSDAKAAVAQTGCLDIGAMYTPVNAGISLVCDISSNMLTIGLYLGGDGTVYIDWGDGTSSTATLVDGEGGATHTYSTAGRYIINAHANDSSSIVGLVEVDSSTFVRTGYVLMSKEIWASAGNGIRYAPLGYPIVEALLLSPGNGWFLNTYLDSGTLPITALITPTGTPYSGLSISQTPSLKTLSIANGYNGTISIENSRIERLVLPSTIGTIGNIYLLADLYVLATTPPTLSGSLAGIKSIHVPNGSLSAYQSATNWSNYTSIMVEMPAAS